MTAVACAHAICDAVQACSLGSLFRILHSFSLLMLALACSCERGKSCFTGCTAQRLFHAGVLPDANVVSSIPMMLEAFCLHEKGRALITDHAPLRALVPLLSHRAYCTPDSAGMAPLQLPDFSSGLEELVRHMPHALCYQAVDAVLASLRVRDHFYCGGTFHQRSFVLVVCPRIHLGIICAHGSGSPKFGLSGRFAIHLLEFNLAAISDRIWSW